MKYSRFSVINIKDKVPKNIKSLNEAKNLKNFVFLIYGLSFLLFCSFDHRTRAANLSSIRTSISNSADEKDKTLINEYSQLN